MARDCTVNRDPNASHGPPAMMKGGFDSEYASLMEELGETGKGSGGDGRRWNGGGHDVAGGGSNVPPWRRPEVWQSSSHNANPQGNFRPPQGSFNGYGGGPGGGYGGGGGQGWNGGQPGYDQQQQQQGSGGYYQQGQSQDYGAGYAQYYQNQYSQQLSAPAH